MPRTAANITTQIILNLNDLRLRDMVSAPSTTVRIGQIGKEADGTLPSRALRVGGGIQHIGRGIVPFPNLVIEVAHSNESLPKLYLSASGDWYRDL
jgi:hypothetical protein